MTKTLETIAVDRNKGKVLWRQPVTVDELERVHAVSNQATATPATDGQRVYVYFGSCGLRAYDMDGKLAWALPLPVAKAMFGSGASPVLGGDLVLLSRDESPEPLFYGVSKSDGKVVWKTSPGGNPRFPGHSTPVVFNGQALLHRAGELVGFDLKDGSRRWWVTLNSGGNSTPMAQDGVLYVAAWSNFGHAELLPELPKYESLLEKSDQNKDGKISRDEMPGDLFLMARPDIPDIPGARMGIKQFFNMIDRDKSGFLEKEEWDRMTAFRSGPNRPEHGLTAIKPVGDGALPASAVLWKESKSVPEVPAPLRYGSRVYMAANGGIVTCLDAATGKVLYRDRLGAPGPYYSSPVAANGKLYFSSGEGVVTVIEDADSLKVLARNQIGEPIFATPAIIGNTIYIRTIKSLYAFGK